MKKSFPPFHKATNQSLHFKKSRRYFKGWRLVFFPIFIGSISFILVSRLFQLTIVKGSYYRYLAENNRLKEISLEAPRGDILDRKGFTIAYSQKNQPETNYQVKRIYNDPEAFAHTIGYRQIASKEEIKQDDCHKTRLKPNDKVGKEGVEKAFECLLRGKPGKKLIEVDAVGRYLKTVTILPPHDGQTIQTALDLELQKKAYEALTATRSAAFGKKAAVIAIIPKTGEILTLISTPSFSSQDFEDNNQKTIQSYLNDDIQPLFNRVTRGVYPPGSVFKLTVAAGALEEDAIDAHFQVEDTGQIKAGNKIFGNWYFLQYGKTEGLVNIIGAIRRSNDIFFYKTGERLGETKIKIWGERFGFGKKTGVELDEETGLLPSRFWKKEILKEGWFLGDTYNLAIGQGYLLTTPLQVNRATAVFANNGYLCKPQLLKVKEDGAKPECQQLSISEKTLITVREGMRQACQTGGTGWPFFNFKVKSEKLAPNGAEGLKVNNQKQYEEKEIQVGCKTGTAQSHAASQLPHAWFTIFAPFEKPEIVLTVLVEESGEGSNIAAPIAKEILTAYFERNE